MRVVAQALQAFGPHVRDPLGTADLEKALGISLDCGALRFGPIDGVTPAVALQDHRFNPLFATLIDRPRQALAQAVQCCGLGPTAGGLTLWTQRFGSEMRPFLLPCRRALEERRFRRLPPEPEALVLPP